MKFLLQRSEIIQIEIALILDLPFRFHWKIKSIIVIDRVEREE